MTRRYLIRCPNGSTATVGFSAPRSRYSSAEWRTAVLMTLTNWELMGYRIIRRLPYRKIRPDAPGTMRIDEP